MQKFLYIGKMSTLGFWVLPLLALFGVLGEVWGQCILWIGMAIFFAHLGELLVIQGKLRMNDRDSIHDAIMVILVGFFHWLPIVKEQK